jgi:hypothetical protein
MIPSPLIPKEEWSAETAKAAKAAELEQSRRARAVMRAVTRKSIKFGGESREKSMRVSFGTDFDDPRTTLIEALAAAVGSDHAHTVADALDAYLATDSANRVPAFQWSPPNVHVELNKTIQERDEAVARAERAELALAKKKKKTARPQLRRQEAAKSTNP